MRNFINFLDLGHNEHMHILGEQWRTAGAAVQRDYQQREQWDRERYEQEMQDVEVRRNQLEDMPGDHLDRH
jgi:hypothetical protein